MYRRRKRADFRRFPKDSWRGGRYGRNRMRCQVNIRLAVHGRFHKAVFKGLNSADMVVMQMGNPRLRQHQAVADEEYQNGRGIGRIDAGGVIAVLNHPDVVVV